MFTPSHDGLMMLETANKGHCLLNGNSRSSNSAYGLYICSEISAIW